MTQHSYESSNERRMPEPWGISGDPAFSPVVGGDGENFERFQTGTVAFGVGAGQNFSSPPPPHGHRRHHQLSMPAAATEPSTTAASEVPSPLNQVSRGFNRGQVVMALCQHLLSSCSLPRQWLELARSGHHLHSPPTSKNPATASVPVIESQTDLYAPASDNGSVRPTATAPASSSSAGNDTIVKAFQLLLLPLRILPPKVSPTSQLLPLTVADLKTGYPQVPLCSVVNLQGTSTANVDLQGSRDSATANPQTGFSLGSQCTAATASLLGSYSPALILQTLYGNSQ
ncbi:hypothetical protein CRENBAI_002986 [Crenichthys baileyi]|uniref:Uncharacterized protein n=1 Tax=Crenichthys baileyi TaxID=28760 RepID=A0AAV9QWC1_9TELE